MCALKAFVLIGCLLSVAVARPQINWNDLFIQVPPNQQQQQPQGPGVNPIVPFFPTNSDINTIVLPATNGATTAAPAATVTTPSPQYLACLESCRTTSEYNPVCGSDTLNYHNTGRLQCAQTCGKEVVMIRMGTCRPL